MAKKILVIEDDVDLNTIIKLNLQKVGFDDRPCIRW